VEEEIGRGGMGIVYRAWDAQLERRVAVKVMNAGYAINREAKLLAQLEHPGIAPVYDAGTLPDGRWYYAMRLIQGRRLDEFLRAEPALPARLRLFEKICEAVAFAHNRGVIHCDLKPQNIMVGEFGEVFVVDWGVARALDGAPFRPRALRRTWRRNNRADARRPSTRAPTFSRWAAFCGTSCPIRRRGPWPPSRKRPRPGIRGRFGDVQQLAADVGGSSTDSPWHAYRDTVPERLVRFCRRNQVLLLLLGTYFAVKLLLYFLAPALK
jgi:predicted Ser/Thr protein kinase